MENKICSECGTENESKYIYCKNCGAPLVKTAAEKKEQTEKDTVNKTEQAPVYSANSDVNIQSENNGVAGTSGGSTSYGGSQFDGTSGSSGYTGFSQGVYSSYQTDTSYTIGGLPAEDIAFFIGKKASDIMPKFMTMEFSGSKVSWCWPAALLGFFLGPMGAAIWFLYRKMYKIGVLLLVLGAALNLFLAALSYNPSLQDTSDIFDAFASGDADFVDDVLWGEKTILSRVADGIDMAASVASCIVTGLLGFYAYKEHCIKAIRNYRMTGIDSRYYRIGLSSVGGISGGMVAVGIVSIIVVSNISTLITAVMSLI